MQYVSFILIQKIEIFVQFVYYFVRKCVPFSKWSYEELLKVLVHWSRESYMLLSKESLLKDDDVTILSLR